MFRRKANLAVHLRQAVLPRCCAVLVGVASCASAMAAEAPAYRYLDENDRAAYSQYPPAGIPVKKVYTMSGTTWGTPRPRYGEESRYAALRQDSSPALERRQSKIAAEAREKKLAAETAAECRRNHEIGCRNTKTAAAVNSDH